MQKALMQPIPIDWFLRFCLILGLGSMQNARCRLTDMNAGSPVMGHICLVEVLEVSFILCQFVWFPESLKAGPFKLDQNHRPNLCQF